MSVKHVKDVPANAVKAGDLASMQVLISAQGRPALCDATFRDGTQREECPGIPTRWNMSNICWGHAKIGIGEEEFVVRSGDVVFIPEGVPHWYQNIGEDNFEFLCIIPNKVDECYLS